MSSPLFRSKEGKRKVRASFQNTNEREEEREVSPRAGAGGVGVGKGIVPLFIKRTQRKSRSADAEGRGVRRIASNSEKGNCGGEGDDVKRTTSAVARTTSEGKKKFSKGVGGKEGR